MTCYRLAFPSSINCCDELRESLRVVSVIEGYCGQFATELSLSLHEAFVNAVIHGNGGNDDLSVSITLRASADDLLVHVRDCGPGFNLDEVANPVDGENLLKQSGRGIYFIRKFTDRISQMIVPEGSVLILRYIPY
jgi:serine/threonine-protein kinase RsbW